MTFIILSIREFYLDLLCKYVSYKRREEHNTYSSVIFLIIREFYLNSYCKYVSHKTLEEHNTY